jgi:hypothetical protein
VKVLGYSSDDAACHTFSQNLVLVAGTNLLGCFFAAQMALPWLTEFDFPRTGYLKSFGYSFVRLLHFMEKSDYITFLGTGKQVKYSSNIVN